MKKFLFTAAFISLIGNLCAQQEITFVSLKKEVTTINSPKKVLKNVLYLEEFKENNYSSQIEDFHTWIANYDISKNEVYSKNEKSTYNVVFKDGNNMINATFNNKGVIIKSFERYKDIKLPYKFSSQIMKENPGWSYEDIQCEIQYSQGKPKLISYTVKIKKGTQTKSIKI